MDGQAAAGLGLNRGRRGTRGAPAFKRPSSFIASGTKKEDDYKFMPGPETGGHRAVESSKGAKGTLNRAID